MPMPPLPLKDNHFFLRPHANPVLYLDERQATSLTDRLDRSTRPADLEPVLNASGRLPRKIHVVVFVHGFQGNSSDLRLFRNHMQVINPTLSCLMSKCNEGKTFDGIEGMGERLAGEVFDFIRQFHDPTTRKRKVSSDSLNVAATPPYLLSPPLPRLHLSMGRT